MAGTKTGSKKAAETMKAKFGDDYYSRIGRKGGQVCCRKGFAADPIRAKEAGRKGGLAHHVTRGRQSKKEAEND